MHSEYTRPECASSKYEYDKPAWRIGNQKTRKEPKPEHKDQQSSGPCGEQVYHARDSALVST